jgi:hypothetical protein
VNTTGPLEILVMIVLLLVVVGCAIVCVVAVRWLRRIALQVEEDRTTRRERGMAADEREAAERDRDAARQLAEHEAVLDLRRIQRRVALAEEELAKGRLESVKAQTEAAKSQAEAARSQAAAAQARAEAAEAQAATANAQTETARAQTDLFRAQSALARAHEAAAQDGARRAMPPADPDRQAGDLAAILRRLGLPTGLGDGGTEEDVSVSGLDPRVLRRLQGLIPPEVMRRLTSGRGPGDIESIGDWIRSQIEKSMEDGDGGAGRDGNGREGSGREGSAGGGAGRGAAGRRGAGRGDSGRRPAGFQRDDSSDDHSGAVNDSDDESNDLSDALPDVLADAGDMPESHAATASSGGLDVSALIEEALRDRARRREGETSGAKGDEEPGADGREDPGADGGGGTATSSEPEDD